MIQHIMTVYDNKAKAYLPPFFLPAVGMASRTFADCVNSDDHQFGRHPQDYTLFELGTFEDNKATFDIFPAPVSVGNGVEFLEPDEQPDLFKDPANEIPDDTPVLSSAKSGNSA